MTEKELHKLSRQDLLQLLLAQSREVARQKSSIEELKESLSQEKALTERLKDKLNDKDETIEHLKRRLDDKDESLGRIKGEAEELRAETEKMRARLEDKDLALDIARARLDAVAFRTPKSGQLPPPERSELDPEEKKERLRYLRELLEKNKEAMENLRKGT